MATKLYLAEYLGDGTLSALLGRKKRPVQSTEGWGDREDGSMAAYRVPVWDGGEAIITASLTGNRGRGCRMNIVYPEGLERQMAEALGSAKKTAENEGRDLRPGDVVIRRQKKSA